MPGKKMIRSFGEKQQKINIAMLQEERKSKTKTNEIIKIKKK